jgi:hypothetical protein
VKLGVSKNDSLLSRFLKLGRLRDVFRTLDWAQIRTDLSIFGFLKSSPENQETLVMAKTGEYAG